MFYINFSVDGPWPIDPTVNRKEESDFATALSPGSKKRTGRAYVALAREFSQK